MAYRGKKIFEANQCGPGSETLLLSLHLRFVDCERKCANLRFADWHASEISSASQPQSLISIMEVFKNVGK